MAIKTPSFFGEATDHVEEIKKELRVQSGYLRSLVSTDISEETETFRWLKSSGTSDPALGTLSLTLENRMGFAMELVSWAAQAGTASNGVILFYLSSAEPQNLIWSAPMTQYNSDKFTSGMIVPVNGQVVVNFGAVGNSVLCFANVLARRAKIADGKPYRPANNGQGW